MHTLSGEPQGKHVVIVDDLVQTGGTLIQCAKVRWSLLPSVLLSVLLYNACCHLQQFGQEGYLRLYRALHLIFLSFSFVPVTLNLFSPLKWDIEPRHEARGIFNQQKESTTEGILNQQNQQLILSSSPSRP